MLNKRLLLGPVSVVAVLSEPTHRHALSCAVAKAFPLVSLASSSGEKPPRAVDVSFASPWGGAVAWPASADAERAALHASSTAAAAVRLALTRCCPPSPPYFHCLGR